MPERYIKSGEHYTRDFYIDDSDYVPLKVSAFVKEFDELMAKAHKDGIRVQAVDAAGNKAFLKAFMKLKVEV